MTIHITPARPMNMFAAFKRPHGLLLALACMLSAAPVVAAIPSPGVRIDSGNLAGIHDAVAGLDEFRGVPYAAPPVGPLRWKRPQPCPLGKACDRPTGSAPRCMQRPLFGDMMFRSDGMSEDCLYLNVWTPAQRRREKLPVLVYFYGGGFVAGDGSEPRYDGASLARRGIVTVTVNYRLGVFGFLAQPESDRRVAAPRLRQLRPARPERGAALGPAQHRRVWRRPGSRSPSPANRPARCRCRRRWPRRCRRG